jgi:hypothetical protein
VRRFALLIVLALAGCTMNTNTPQTAREAGTVRADLATRLDETRSAQAAALDLWDRIIFGETVSCQEAIPVPEPVTLPEVDRAAYPQAAAIQAQIGAAIQAIRNASDLWNIECGETREAVPLDMAREGRTNALAASAPLDSAVALLAAWP